MTPPITPKELIESLDAPAAVLAEGLSLAIRIEPQLLRKMRLELLPASDAGVEADLWFSPLVESRAPSGIVLQQAVAELLRHRLREKLAVLEVAWRVIEVLHRNVSPAIFAEERLAYLALAGKHDEMHELLRSVVATLVSPRGRALAGWAARAIARLPHEAKYSEEAQMLAFGASLRLGQSGVVEGLLPFRVNEWAAWLSPADMETVPFGIALLEDAVEIGPVGRPRSHRIDLPKTTPALVELGWHDGSQERSERVLLQPRDLRVIEIGPGVRDVDIRTVLGDSYWLTMSEPRERESVQKKLQRLRPPKVHISYDFETGGAIEKKELPFVAGVLADFSGMQKDALPRLRDRKFVQIDRENFDQVLAAMNLRVGFEVDNFVDPDGGNLRVEIKLRGFEDFEPVQVARHVEPLRRLLENRLRIDQIRSLLEMNAKLGDGLEKIMAFVARRQAKSRWRSERTPYFAEVVVSVENAAGVKKDRAEELVTAFIDNVDLPSGSQDLNAAAHAAISTIDTRLSKQLRQILHHPDFQALESVWRGLRHLVLQTETSDVLKIRVFNVDKHELAKDLSGAPEIHQSATFKKIYDDVYNVLGGEPFGLLVGAYEFDQSREDVELLENVSRMAATCHCPFLTGASANMLHLDSFGSLGAKTPNVEKIFESPEFAKWNSFRESDDSRYVGLTLPRILLRLPYGRDTHPVEEFNFEENVNPPHHSQFLWGNAAFALATCVTEAFARYSWCAAIRGVEGGGLVEGLPTYTFSTDDGDVAPKCPTEIEITDRRETELSRSGFIPLVHARMTDYAAFFSVNSVHRTKPYDSSEAASAARLTGQLPYIFACSRFAQYIRCMARDKIGSFTSSDQAQSWLTRWIADYVLLDDNASTESKAKYPLREAHIEVVEPQDEPAMYRVVAFLRPHFQLDELAVSLRVVVQLPAPTRLSHDLA